MAFEMLDRPNMYTTIRLLALSTAVGLLAASCGEPRDAPAPPGRSIARLPELPRLESRPLAPVPHGSPAPRRAAPPAMATPGSRRIDLKLLVITAVGDEPAFLAASSALDRIGVPHDVLIAATDELTPAMLSDGVDHCNYRGVVIAVGGLGFVDPATGSWTSAFTAAEWTILGDFERACAARELVWYGWPGAEFGLAMASSFSDAETVTARLTADGAGVFPFVQANAAIPIENAYGYRAVVTDPATTSLVQTGDGYTLVARRVHGDGRETLIATVDSNPYLVHALVLESGMVSWVSRDLYLGKKRAYLSPQVDDIFIDNDMWNPQTHSNPEDGSNTFRITGSDLAAFVSWQADLRGMLPAGSTYLTAMAFNGAGTQRREYPDQTLLAAARAAGPALAWVNHTWDHENMDAMARTTAAREVTSNCARAVQLGLAGFSCTELVTPDMSGLTNPTAVLGILDAGARSVVSDTSITPEIAAERGTTPGNNPSFNVGRVNARDARLYQVPRHPTSVFYDVSTRAAAVDEYNTIYRGYWGRDLGYAEILAFDTEFGLHYLLSGDIDPLMFHQANLRAELVDSLHRCLVCDWVETSAMRYAALLDAPILTLPQRDIANAMMARAAYDACGVTATYVEGAGAGDGRPDTIELSSSGTCSAPVTGVTSPLGLVEIYGGVPTTEVAMSPGTIVTIPLPLAPAAD